MTPEQLSDAIVAVLHTLVDEGLVSLADGPPATVTIERPRDRSHGDYATNVALQLAKKAGTNPRNFAELVADKLREFPGVAAVDIAGPGFLNLSIDAGTQGRLAAEIVAAGSVYGSSTAMLGERVNLEFVSANPTGPLHLGGTRWAAVGDALGRIFTFSGADVTREYYFNDHGAQIDRFARSLLAAAAGRLVPEDGYGGHYIAEIAAQVVALSPDALTLPEADAQEVFRSQGVDLMFTEIKQKLHDFGVDFDVYFHENDLHQSGAVEKAIDRLREIGNIYEADGATWLRTEKYGDDKDRVVIKSDGNAAYISGDLAYYLNKRERGFDRCLIMLGADHHGYIGRMMAMCAAFGDKPGENLEILIGQMVNLLSHDEVLKMSKRAGTIITMDDLVEAIGRDAARYALTRYTNDTNIDIDLELWTKASGDNPVYYVQYAAARTASILRNARDLGLAQDPSLVHFLVHEKEGELLRSLADFPGIVMGAAELREPHRVARYLEDTAGAFHRFYDKCLVLPRGDEQPADIHRARLVLVAATRQVFESGLGLLGVSAPERM